jgi:uncharacterized protein YbjT (DUF2867 family)
MSVQQPTVLVIGATGRTGRRILEDLKRTGVGREGAGALPRYAVGH